MILFIELLFKSGVLSNPNIKLYSSSAQYFIWFAVYMYDSYKNNNGDSNVPKINKCNLYLLIK